MLSVKYNMEAETLKACPAKAYKSCTEWMLAPWFIQSKTWNWSPSALKILNEAIIGGQDEAGIENAAFMQR